MHPYPRTSPWDMLTRNSQQRHSKQGPDDKTLIDVTSILFSYFGINYADGLVQDCGISSVLAMEILQSCAKASIENIPQNMHIICFVCIQVLSGLMWIIYPYPSRSLNWHWGNHMIVPQSYDYSNASEVTLKDMGKFDWNLILSNRNETQQNMNLVRIILGMSSANKTRHYIVTPPLIGWAIDRMIPARAWFMRFTVLWDQCKTIALHESST